MKKLLIILVCLCFVTGCARYNWKERPDKTNNDWTMDDAFCTQSSQRSGAVWSLIDNGELPNDAMRKDYERCMKEKGWLD